MKRLGRPGILLQSLKKIGPVAGANAALRLSRFTLFVVAARLLEPPEVGLLAAWLVLVNLPSAIFGGALLRPIVVAAVRDYDYDGAAGAVTIAQLSIAALLLASVTARPSLAPVAIAALGGFVAEVSLARAQWREEPQVWSMLNGCRALTGGLLAPISMAMTHSVEGAMLALAGADIFAVIKVTGMPVVFSQFRSGARLIRREWRQAVALGGVALVGFAYLRFDVVVIERFINLRALGIYSAAAKVVEASTLLSVAVSVYLQPVVARRVRNGSGGYASITGELKVIGGVGLVVSALVLLGGPYTLRLLFGPEYGPSERTLQVLALSIPFLYMNAITSTALVAAAQSRRLLLAAVLALVAATAIAKVGLSVLAMGVIAVAGAKLVGEAVNFIVQYTSLVYNTGPQPQGPSHEQ